MNTITADNSTERYMDASRIYKNCLESLKTLDVKTELFSEVCALALLAKDEMIAARKFIPF